MMKTLQVYISESLSQEIIELRNKLKKIIAIALVGITIFSCGYFMNNKSNQDQTNNQYKNLSYKISNTNVKLIFFQESTRQGNSLLLSTT